MPTSVAVILTVGIAATVLVFLGMLAQIRGRKPDRHRVFWVGAGLVIGAIPAVALLIHVAFGASDLRGTNRLSSAHATLDGDCAACHVSVEMVSSEKCTSCHEQFPRESGTYGYEAHYTYHSADRSRAVGRERKDEVGCATCHMEHRRRRADLLATASDRQCAGCHMIGGFDDRHPEFDVLAENLVDDAGLTFGHVRHVEYVQEGGGLNALEQACLACHVSANDERGFLPISFDTACAACHLTGDMESAELPVQTSGVRLLQSDSGGVALNLGVERIETVRERLGLGEQWASRASAAQFEVDDGVVVKTGITHADPWILHNLRRLRRAVYPSAVLADLLVVSADIAPQEPWTLYDEALGTLRARMDDLRGRDESWVHTTLLEFDQMVNALDRELADPASLLDGAPFQLGAADPRLTAAQIDEIDAFAVAVAGPCLQCHVVEHATIGRVQKAQAVLRRARFDHRPHVMLRGCVDCHDRMPFIDYIGSNGSINPAPDGAEIHSIPGIATCRECHTTSLALNQCRACHEFHPERAAALRRPP